MSLGRRAWSAASFDLGGVPTLALGVGTQVMILRPGDAGVLEVLPMESKVFSIAGERFVQVGSTMRRIRLEPT